MKRAVKKQAALLAHRVSRLVGARLDGFLVLTYHKISALPEPMDRLAVSVETFHQQMKFVKERFNVISGGDLARSITRDQKLPPDSCLVTFDDGWADNYENGFPVLKSVGISALIFISTDYIGTGREFWYEKLRRHAEDQPERSEALPALPDLPDEVRELLVKMSKLSKVERVAQVEKVIKELKKYPPCQLDRIGESLALLEKRAGSTEKPPAMLTWPQVREMHSWGVMFGSHGKSHSILTRLGSDEVLAELVESKENIESRLSAPVYFLAYPNGDYSGEIVDMAARTGYLGSFSCVQGRNRVLDHPHELRRMHIGEESSVDPWGHFSATYFEVELSGIRQALRRIIKT